MAQERSDINGLELTDSVSSNTTAGVKSESKDLGLAAAEMDGEDRPEQTEQIKENIEETRSQMGETIDAIQEKLSFSNLSDQVSEHVNNAVETAKGAVYDATIGKAATFMKNFGSEISSNSIVQTAKNNPLPFILIGAGAGLLAYKTYASGRAPGYKSRQLAARRGAASITGYGDQHDTNSLSGDTASGKINGAAETVSNAAGTAYDKVTSVIDTAWTGAGDIAGQAYGKVGDAGTAVREQYEYYIDENPLAVGAVALALGAAVGLAIPATRYEGQLMGQARQDLMDKAGASASELLDKTKQMVTEAGRTVTEQAQSAISENK